MDVILFPCDPYLFMSIYFLMFFLSLVTVVEGPMQALEFLEAVC